MHFFAKAKQNFSKYYYYAKKQRKYNIKVDR